MKKQRYVIGIGAQKAGTTWLANYFSHHPEIFMSPIKELHFFDSKYRPDLCGGFERRFLHAFKMLVNELEQSDLTKKPGKMTRIDVLYDRVNMNNNILKYKRFFIKRIKSEQVFCEITPEYALLDKKGYEAIRSLSEDVKIIFLMRNPVDRFWSALRMWKKQHPEINLVEQIDEFLTNPQFVERTDYKKTIENIYQVFEPSNILIEFYENLFSPESLKNICQFSGVSYIEPDFANKIHEGIQKEIDPQLKHKILGKFGTLYEWARQQYGEDLPESWLNDLHSYKSMQL